MWYSGMITGRSPACCWNSSGPKHWPEATTSSPAPAPCTLKIRSTRFVDRENLSGFRARLRFNDRAASELIDQAVALMAQAKNCHDELETYYRTAVNFAQVDAAAAQCMELFGVG